MTREEILEKRMVEFDAWLENQGVSEVSPEGCLAELAWNAALDSVVIEMQEKPECSDEYDDFYLGYRVAIATCEDLIKKQGYLTK